MNDLGASLIIRHRAAHVVESRVGLIAVKDFDDIFAYVWRHAHNRDAIRNRCLSGAGYVAGYKRTSQIMGQSVVLKASDVRIVAREGGQAHMVP